MGKQATDSSTDIRSSGFDVQRPKFPSSKFEIQRSELENPVRIDKWLWATRVFKTRSDATEACRSSAIRLNGAIAKPSAKVRHGDTVTARTKALTRTLHVIGLTEKRVGAKRLPEYFEDQTPESEYELASEKRENARLYGNKGAGRPTKKDRRSMEQENAERRTLDSEW